MMGCGSSPTVMSVHRRQNSPTGADHKINHTQYHCQMHCPGKERCFSDRSRTHQTYSVATQTQLTSFPLSSSVPRNNSAADCSSASPSVDIQPEREKISEEGNMESIMSAGQVTDQIREIGDEVTNILQRTVGGETSMGLSCALFGLVTFVTGFTVMYLYPHTHLDPNKH